jgi:hypothetical protein
MLDRAAGQGHMKRQAYTEDAEGDPRLHFTLYGGVEASSG